MTAPTHETVAGRAYLALRKKAKAEGAEAPAIIAFSEALSRVFAFADPVLVQEMGDKLWEPTSQLWG